MRVLHAYNFKWFVIQGRHWIVSCNERNRRIERENASKREQQNRKQRRKEPIEIIGDDDENFQETFQNDKDESDIVMYHYQATWSAKTNIIC